MNTTTLEKLTKELNAQQKQAVEMPLNSFTKVVAGAGTGKTKIISKRYIKLVYDLIKDNLVEKPLEHLLVITFTQKAAAEMKERILKELKENKINTFGQETRISTIHAFCSEMLKRHAIEANLSPNFQLGDDNRLQEIYDTIIRKIRYGEYETIENLDEVLQELNLDKDILSHENILKLKAAGTLEDIFDSVLPIIKQVKSLGLTPIEFLEKTTSAIPQYTAFLTDFSKKKFVCSHFSDIYSDEKVMAEDWSHFFQNCDYADENYKNMPENTAFESLLSKFVNKNGARKSPKTVAWTPIFDTNVCQMLEEISEVEILFTKIIAIIYGTYQRQLEELDLTDFDDLINKTLYILKNNEVIRAYYKKYFKHIIVDEFQDTSGAQLDLLMNLLSDEEPDLTIVGDRKQSIYGFRYARMENLDIIQKKVEQKFKEKPNFSPDEKIKVIKLETNYRSTAQVLDAVNAVTEQSLRLDEPLSANRTENISNSIKFTQPETCDSMNAYRTLEAKYIANEIHNKMSQDGLKFKDFAVLIKTHAQANFLEEQLAKFGIPSVKKVNTSYFSKAIVCNIKYLLNFAQNIRNEIALVKLLEIKFSDKEIFELKKAIDEILVAQDVEYVSTLNFSEKIIKVFELNIFDEINCPQSIKNAVKSLYEEVFEIIKNKNTLSLTAIFYKLIEIYPPYHNLTGIAKSLADIDVSIFEKILADYVKNAGYASIKNFLEYFDTISEDNNFELPSVFTGEIDAVNLMTIHASKGLEFPYVFVAGISNKKGFQGGTSASIELNENCGNFGLIINKFKGKDSPKSLLYKIIHQSVREYAEAKRRFYVAVSRAEKYLNVLVCNTPEGYLKELIDPKAGLLKDLVCPIEDKNLSDEKRPLSMFLPEQQTELKIIAPKFSEEKPEKTPMSFSKINTFKHCARKYLLKYSLEYPEICKKSSGIVVGSILHNLIYHSLMNDKTLSDKEIKDFLGDINFESDEYKKISALYSVFAKSKFAKLSSAEILAEYSFEFVYKNTVFRGDIDLVIKNSDGTVDLIDFKTNENIEQSLTDYYKQMFIYKSALEETGFCVAKMEIVNIKPDGLVEIAVSESDIENAKKEINSDLKGIKELSGQKPSELPTSNNCKYCGYNYICETN